MISADNSDNQLQVIGAFRLLVKVIEFEKDRFDATCIAFCLSIGGLRSLPLEACVPPAVPCCASIKSAFC